MVGLSEEDQARIREFARTPRYQREPSQLVPDTEEESEDAEETGDESPRSDAVPNRLDD